jgi:hypothetical protein
MMLGRIIIGVTGQLLDELSEQEFWFDYAQDNMKQLTPSISTSQLRFYVLSTKISDDGQEF